MASSPDVPRAVTGSRRTVGAAATFDQLAAYDAAGCGAEICGASWFATFNGDLNAYISSNLAVAGGVVYADSQWGLVEAFDATGCGELECAPIASVSAPGRPRNLMVSRGRLFVGTETGTAGQGTMAAFAPTG